MAGALQQLEEGLQPGDSIIIEISRPRYDNPGEHPGPRFTVDHVTGWLYDGGQENAEHGSGNTISGALTDLLAEIERHRPMTKDEFRAVLHQLLGGVYIQPETREKFLAKLKEMW